MRIAYVVAWRGGRLTGPFGKIAEQTRIWAELDHEVGLFVSTSPHAAEDWRSLPHTVFVGSHDRGGLATLGVRLRGVRAVAEWRPDVVYLRHGLTTPGLAHLVRTLPTVVEVNGDDVEVAAASSWIKALWARLSRGRVLRHVAAAVFMTPEMANRPRFAKYGIPSTVVPNGIDLARSPTLPPKRQGPLRLVMLGHPDSPWHGADKLVPLALRHPDWRIDMIGPSRADLGVEPPPNVELHGELDRPAYLELLAEADVGMGSLAMHRIGQHENPALKVREYLALGLPVISGCADPDFPRPVPYLLVLENTEANVDDGDQRIADFVLAWHGRRVAREELTHLDLRAKEQTRLDVLQAAARPVRR